MKWWSMLVFTAVSFILVSSFATVTNVTLRGKVISYDEQTVVVQVKKMKWNFPREKINVSEMKKGDSVVIHLSDEEFKTLVKNQGHKVKK